jgi:molecular chaperone GrpE
MKQEEQKNKNQQQQQKAEEQEQEKQQEQGQKQKTNNKQAQNKQAEEEKEQAEQTEKQEEQKKSEQKTEGKEDKKSKGKKKSGEKDKEKKEKKEKTDAEKLAELNDKYLRLTAEYDNYRRRTLREKMELSKSAGEEILQSMLPVVDDFDRALESIDESQDIEAVKEGIHLIYNKFKDVLGEKGVKEIEAKDQEFDTDKHEAVSKIPAPSEDMKGKVVDVVQKGYYLNDKVLRFSKVVVGE